MSLAFTFITILIDFSKYSLYMQYTCYEKIFVAVVNKFRINESKDLCPHFKSYS